MPKTVADELETWDNHYAADGFNLTLDLYPNEMSYLVDGLIPILQEKNLFRENYEEVNLSSS